MVFHSLLHNTISLLFPFPRVHHSRSIQENLNWIVQYTILIDWKVKFTHIYPYPRNKKECASDRGTSPRTQCLEVGRFRSGRTQYTIRSTCSDNPIQPVSACKSVLCSAGPFEASSFKKCTFWTKKNQLYLIQGCGRNTQRQAVLYPFMNSFEGTSLLSFET